jgi:hypothetical protein
MNILALSFDTQMLWPAYSLSLYILRGVYLNVCVVCDDLKER